MGGGISINTEKTIDLSDYNYEDRHSKFKNFEYVNKFKNILTYKIDNEKAIVTYCDDSKCLNVIYKYKSCDEIIRTILEDGTIDLSFHFIEKLFLEDFDNVQINNMKAYSSVWIGKVNFDGVSFSGKINFSFSKFYSEVSFRFVDFGNYAVNFRNCTFKCDKLDYSHSKFKNMWLFFNNSFFECNNITFNYVDFGNGIQEFNSVEFNNSTVAFEFATFDSSGISFINSKFIGVLTFNKCGFLGGNLKIHSSDFQQSKIKFNECSMEQTKINFDASYFDKIIFNKIVFEKDFSLRANSVETLVLRNCNIKSDLLMDKRYVDNSENQYEKDSEYINYKYLSFEDTKITGNVYIDWKRNNIYNAIENFSNKKSKSYECYNPTLDKMSQYRTLKTNFNRIGYYEDEDNALVKFMDNYFALSKSKGTKYASLIFNKIGGYGTNPTSIISASALLIIIFAIIYMTLGIEYGDKINLIPIEETNGIFKYMFLYLNKLIISIYFSGITFLTIGYGDIYPTNIFIMFFTIVEGFLGVFMMSYFSIAVVRKILR